MNMNQVVFVKLTEVGKAVHRAKYDELVKAGLPKSVTYEFHEDADGWSPWQFHTFCSIFGEYMDQRMSNERSAVLSEFTIMLPVKHMGPNTAMDTSIKLNH
jgi:hypothetical protein